MRARIVVERAAAGCLGMILGCLGTDAFLCESDEVCQQGGVSGLCQPSGYCSFPDEDCDSGQRYGVHAGGSLPGTCVGLEPLTGDTGASEDGVSTNPLTTSTSVGTSTTGVTTLTTVPPLTDDGPMTTTPVDDSDTGGSTGPIPTDEGEDDPPATTTGPAAMEVCWDDDFENGMIDPEWCPYTDPGIVVDEVDGHLRFVFVPPDFTPGTGGGGWASLCEWFALLGAEAATELNAVPQVSPYTEGSIELGNHELRLGMGVLGGELYAFVYDGMNYSGVTYQPYEPDAHRWLRILGTEEGFVAEASPDGMEWAHVYTLPADLEGAEGWATLGAWAEMVPLGPDEATFEQFHLCYWEG